MMKISGLVEIAKVSIVTIFLLTSALLIAQVPNSYYLPDISYNAEIPDPESILGFQIGEWHLTHGQLVKCLTTLCDASPNCIQTEYARSHEDKPLINLIISSEKNINQLDQIKAKRSQALEKGHSKKLRQLPMIIYQGYSIHGNESSGANAAPLLAYYLLAGQSQQIDNLMEEAVIIIDPCLNPDGLHRFSTWVNMHKHHNLSSDPRGREFNEPWPSGRTNHYWFDLNRDWLFTIHPSSKGRIKLFQEWQPDILTDHHEMGSNSTFFFQPGVPSRTNPNTPQINQDLTSEIAEFHKINLDSIGSKYFTGKRFDDYYYGKGSTYPDINGCVGILFEQASCRGHLRETDNGLLSFPFTIRNQVVTSLSTQAGALATKDDILQYKSEFYQAFKKQEGAYVFEVPDSHFETKFFIDLLNRHAIDVYKLGAKVRQVKGRSIQSDRWYVVPKSQRQAGLIKTIFEPVSEFRDSVFYDVSAWTMPMAFNMASIDTEQKLDLGPQVTTVHFKPNQITQAKPSQVYMIDWSDYNAPAALSALLEKGLKARVITDNYVKDQDPKTALPKGTILISQNQDSLVTQLTPGESIGQLVESITHKYETSCQLIPINTIARYKTEILKQPKVAMIVGEDKNAYAAGSTWYQIDHRIKMPLTIIDIRQIKSTKLSRYTHIILPDGNYNDQELPIDSLDNWLAKGGTLISMGKAIEFTNQQGWTKMQVPSGITQEKSPAQRIGGAIFEAQVDLTHPLLYGYNKTRLPIFKRGTDFYLPCENAAASPLSYTASPLISGYVSKANLENAAKANGVSSFGYQKGRAIALVDNPNFRGYWLGGSKLFANSLFFSHLIGPKQLQF